MNFKIIQHPLATSYPLHPCPPSEPSEASRETHCVDLSKAATRLQIATKKAKRLAVGGGGGGGAGSGGGGGAH